MYDRLDKAGAVGFVFMAPWKKPGVDLYKHSDWNKCSLCSRKMVAVMVYAGAVDLDAWKSNSDLVLHITPPHDTTYADLLTSWPLILIMRIILPALLFSVGGFSMFVLRRHTKAAAMGNVLETKAEARRCWIVMGVVLASGGCYGQYALPSAFYHCFETFLDGFYILSMFVISRYMKEVKRSSGPKLPPHRSMWRGKRGGVALLVFCAFIFADISVSLMVIAGLRQWGNFVPRPLPLYVCGSYYWCTIPPLCIAPQLKHARMQAAISSMPSSRALDKIWALVCIFIMNGTLIIVMVIAKVLMLVELAHGLPSPLRMYILLCVNGFTRAWSSYWVVIALAPTNTATNTGHHREVTSLRLFRHLLRRMGTERSKTRSESRVFPAPPSSPGIIAVSELPHLTVQPKVQMSDSFQSIVSESSNNDYTTEWPSGQELRKDITQWRGGLLDPAGLRSGGAQAICLLSAPAQCAHIYLPCALFVYWGSINLTWHLT